MDPPSVSGNLPSERWLHGDRARRWGCAVFVAQRLANAASYCQTPEGRVALQKWLTKKHGRVKAEVYMRACPGSPAQKTRKKQAAQKTRNKQSGWAKLCMDAAVDLGISAQAMLTYFAFTCSNSLCEPPRTLPAPRRRRGESSMEWLARRYEALLNGAQYPDIDLAELRRTAISQLDAIRSTMAVWRYNPNFFGEGLFAQASGTILRPSIRNLDAKTQQINLFVDTFLSRLHVAQITHALWYRIAKLFDDLDAMGVKTVSALERAYTNDSRLLWRLVGIISCNYNLLIWLRARTIEVVSDTTYFRQYFNRYPVKDKQALPRPDEQYIERNPFQDGTIDELVVRELGSGEDFNVSFFFEELLKELNKHPEEAKKFDALAFEEIGDLAIVDDCHCAFTETGFGERLRTAAKAAYNAGDTGHLFSEVSFINDVALKVRPTDPHDHWGYADTVLRSCNMAWMGIVETKLDVVPHIIKFLQNVCPCHPKEHWDTHAFDEMWKVTDRICWEEAKRVDMGDGETMRTLGLLDPEDPNRRTCTMFLDALEAYRQYEEELASQPCPYCQAGYKSTIPTAAPTDSCIKSGHAYVTQSAMERPKEKAKKRGVAREPEETVDAEDVDVEDDLPDFLPSTYKLPRKVVKIFHRLLEQSYDDDAACAERKGQVRWSDFEKAMRRIGFIVVLGAGSSVRFDPPAKTARPIAFHRPHPDSVLTPMMLKTFGARLKRCYGWTAADFEQATTKDAEE